MLGTVRSGEKVPQEEQDAASQAFLSSLKTGGGAPEGTPAQAATALQSPRVVEERRIRGDSYSDLVDLGESIQSPPRAKPSAASWRPRPGRRRRTRMGPSSSYPATRASTTSPTVRAAPRQIAQCALTG